MGSMNEYCITGDAIVIGGVPEGCELVSTFGVTIGGQELFAMDADNEAVFAGTHGVGHESPKLCTPELTELDNITIQGQSKMVSIGATAACGDEGHPYGRTIANQPLETLLAQIGIH